MVKPLTGFNGLETHHCITGSMRYIYEYNRHPISEEMLLGLGAGVGFIYWHTKGSIPFIGGRANFTRPGIEGQEKTSGRRTGVRVEIFNTSSTKKAKETMLAMLEKDEPVMIMCDMGYLPYMDFGGEEYHFGGHAVVVCGYDAESREVLVADRDGLHPVPIEILMKARGSTYKPFPPKNQWYKYDFSGKRFPTADEVCQAIQEQVAGMLEPPISNMGVRGIRKAAQRVQKWPDVLSEKDLRYAMFNTYIFIDAKGGTGGGIFRTMFSRFLREGAEMLGNERLGNERLNKIADDFQGISDDWQAVAEIFKQGWEADDPLAVLCEVKEPMLAIAEREETTWTALGSVVF